MSLMLSPEPKIRRRNTGARVVVAVLLVIGLVATRYTRDWAIDEHNAIRNNGHPGGFTASNSDSSLSSMPSFATALLLGGLRGPLVMILWTSSENQKQKHDLEDFDTKVEWIRLLQPEFDTVHLFQIWNKAYNISVQMASLRNKYTTILDAIDYGQKVERERHDDINIITAIAAIYGDKLGTSSEHVYYRARIRRESQTLTRVTFPPQRANEFRTLAAKAGWIEDASPISLDEKTQVDRVLIEPSVAKQLVTEFTGLGVNFAPENRPAAERNDPSWRRVRLDPMLDQNGYILPDLLTPRYPRPKDLPASAPWYDGSTLQFLKQYEPFPYGISTLALAYNDYKRGQYLQTLWGEHHIQIGDTVIDARPALCLKDWANDEWERGRRFELRMWGLYVPESDDPIELEQPTAAFPFDRATPDKADYNAALYSYAMAARLFHDARIEFQQHMKKYEANASVYFIHVDDTLSGEQMMLADHDYLAAASASGSQRQKLLESAAREYRDAMRRFAVTVLKYYIDEPVMIKMYPKDPRTGEQYNRATIESADPSTYLSILQAAKAATARYLTDPVTHRYMQERDDYHDDRQQYLTYLDRCANRLSELHADGIVVRP
ncbi:MAG TPA: hypothetical protein VHX86_19680 [Tepidisphaeraceae bacterium]|jgi:hypothetical protein|nr:hypothetical protein [Tepidisphaeraceae bacterium]